MLLAPTDTFTVTNNFRPTTSPRSVSPPAPRRCASRPSSPSATTPSASTRSSPTTTLARSSLGRRRDDQLPANQTTKAIPLPWLTPTNPSPPGGRRRRRSSRPVILMAQQPLEVPAAPAGDRRRHRRRRPSRTPVPTTCSRRTSVATSRSRRSTSSTSSTPPARRTPTADTRLTRRRHLRCTYYTDRQSNRIGNNSCGVQNVDNPDTADERGCQQQRQRSARRRHHGELGAPGGEARQHHQCDGRQRHRTGGDGELHQASGRDQPRRRARLPGRAPQRRRRRDQVEVRQEPGRGHHRRCSRRAGRDPSAPSSTSLRS